MRARVWLSSSVAFVILVSTIYAFLSEFAAESWLTPQAKQLLSLSSLWKPIQRIPIPPSSNSPPAENNLPSEAIIDQQDEPEKSNTAPVQQEEQPPLVDTSPALPQLEQKINVAVSEFWGVHDEVLGAVLHTFAQMNSTVKIHLYRNTFRWGFDQVISPFFSDRPKPWHSIQDDLKVDTFEQMIQLLVLTSCEYTLEREGEILLKLWDQRQNKFRLGCVVHEAQMLPNVRDQMLEWHKRQAIDIYVLSPHVKWYVEDFLNYREADTFDDDEPDQESAPIEENTEEIANGQSEEESNGEEPSSEQETSEEVLEEANVDRSRRSFKSRRRVKRLQRTKRNDFDKLSIETFVPIFPLKNEQPADRPRITKAVIQGNLESHRRNYGFAFSELEKEVRNNPKLYGYEWQEAASSFVVDATVTDPFKLVLLGSGHIEIPRPIQAIVEHKNALEYPLYYAELSAHDLLLPAFPEEDIFYYTFKASSSIAAALIAEVPLLATKKHIEAYSFLDERLVVPQSEHTSHMETITYLRRKEHSEDWPKSRSAIEAYKKAIYTDNLKVLHRSLELAAFS